MTAARARNHRLPLTALVAVLACLGALVMASSALALPGGSSSSGPGNTPAGSGGGGGKITVNDFLGLGHTTFRFDSSRQRAFEANYCSPSAGTCANDALVMRPDASGHATSVGGRDAYGGAITGSYSAWNRQAFGDIGVANTCPVTVQGGVFNTRPPKGCYFTSNADPRIREIHPKEPGGEATVEGGTQIAMVRIWRSCRATRDDTGRALSYGGRSSCAVQPIYERVAPEHDDPGRFGKTWDNTTYFNVLRGGDGTAHATSSNRHDAFHAASRRIAGPLYSSCARRSCLGAGGAYIGGAYGDYTRTAPAKRNLQSLCQRGPLASGTRWDEFELSKEIAYRASKGEQPYKGHKEAMLDWAAADARDRRPLPPGFTSSRSSLEQLCGDLSEHLSVSWHIGAKTVGGGGANVDVEGNLVPGRVYMVQIVFADARENVTGEAIQMIASTSLKAQRPHNLPPARSFPVTGGADAVLPRGAFIGTYTDNSLSAQPSFLSGDRGNCPRTGPRGPLCLVDAETAWGESVTVDPLDYSLWMPRAAAFSVFNSRDGADGSGTGSYGVTHQVSVNGSGGTPMTMSAGRGGQFPLVFGNSDADHETKAALDGRQVWAGFIPLFPNLTGYRSDLRVANARTTYAPKRGPRTGVGGSTYEPSVASRVRSEETRFMTLLGENRYEYTTWSVGDAAKTVYRQQRLTMDDCSGAALHPDLDLGTGPKPICDPKAALPGSGGWKVRDAYRVPATGVGAPWQDLTSLFSQEKTGKARIDLFLSNPAVASSVAGLEVWDADRYQSRAPGNLPDYRLAVPGATTMRFCDSDSVACLTKQPMDRYGRPADELPAGSYVVRAMIAGGHPAFTWGLGATSFVSTDQRWAVRFNLTQRQESLAVFQARLAG